MFQKLPEPLRRDAFAKAGTTALGVAGVTAITAGIASMPRTTLGITSLAAGLLAAGNRDQLKTAAERWQAKRAAFAKTEAEVTTEPSKTATDVAPVGA